jgi:chromosomal replication initiator protein
MRRKKDVWFRIVKYLKSDLSKPEFDTWISNTSLENLDRDQALIQVPNRFVATWLHDNYLSQIEDAFKTNLDFLPKIRFTFAITGTEKETLHQGPVTSSGTYSGYQLNPLFTFDTFITANSNRFAYSSALNVVEKPAADYNPLYIFSDLSLGKTHLLNAIGNRVISTNPTANVRYVSADRFSSDFLTAEKDGYINELRDEYRALDLLLFDNIHLLASSERPQRELVSCIDGFCESSKQMVLAGPHPPARIKNLIPKLTSRLEWGLLSEIRPPEQKTKTTIIRQRAKDQDPYLPEDVVFFLANSTNNLKILEQRLFDLQTHATLYKRKINMSMTKTIIKNGTSRKTSVIDIQKAIVAHFDISLSQLLSDQRKRKFSYPRQLGMYLSRRLTDLSLKEVGEKFGKKDHSTVLHAVRHIEKDLKDGKSPVLSDVNDLLKLFS